MTQHNYKRLGDYIQLVDKRNQDLRDLPLMGLSISKEFIPSIANTIGTDMSTYRIIRRNHFAYGPVTSRNGEKITIALFDDYDEALISQAYIPFEVSDTNQLIPEYLIMWFRRPEFDRYARFMSHGSAREMFAWEDMCNSQLPVPSIEKQREIVAEYKAIQNRIKLNNQLIQKLEETAQAIYKQWFVEFEFPDENGKAYKSGGGKMVWNEELGRDVPEGWRVDDFDNICSVNSGKANVSQNAGIYPIYGAGGIMAYSSEYLIDEKVLIIGRVGTHGKIFRENSKCWPSDNTLLIKSNYYNYCYYILKFLNYDEINRGGVQALITQTDIKGTGILLPQKLKFLNDFEKQINPFFEMIDIYSKMKNKLEGLKDLLLSKLTTIEK